MNTAYIAAFALIVASRPLSAQGGEIRGVVVEAGTLHPIAGARVLYMRMPDGQPLSPTESEVATNQTGTFRITPTTAGNYQLSVTKEGYPRVSKLVALSPANPSGDVRIEITPLSLVTGRVIDRDTGDPASVQISLETVRHENGRGPLGSGLKVIVPVTIGVDGVFNAPNVPPGLYGLVIKPLLWSRWGERHTVEFEDADRETVDEDYEYSFWPGSGRKEAVLPLQVAASRTNAGALPLRKMRYYRAHVALDGSNCSAGEIFRARLMTVDINEASEEHGLFDVKCGQNFLLRGLAPGSYRLDLAKQGQAVAGRLFGTVAFVITDKNLDLRVATAPGLRLHGSVLLAEGIKAQPPAIRLNAARMPFAFPEERQTVPVDSEGRFVIENLPLGTFQIGFVQLAGTGWIPQEMRHNGRPVLTRTINWDGQGELDIVLDNQPASLSGSVTNASGAEKEPVVVLLRWPPPQAPQGLHAVKTILTGDAEGKFQAGGLPAGEYRVLAVPAAARSRIEEPGVLDGLVSLAEKMMVSRGASVTVSLRVITSVP